MVWATFALAVFVEKVFAGGINPAIQADIAGNSHIPTLRENALFLLPKGGKFLLAIWSDEDRYTRFVERVSNTDHKEAHRPNKRPKFSIVALLISI